MLGARIFFFLYFISGCCSGVQLSWLASVWSFWGLLLSILRQVQSSLQSVSNLAPLLRQYPSVFSSRLLYHEVFLLGLVGVATPPSSVWALGIIPPSFGGLFSGLRSFLACCSILKEAGKPSADFWADLPCPSPRCALICWFWLLWFPTVSSTQGDCQAPFGSLLSLSAMLEISLHSRQQWAGSLVDLTLLPSLKDHCPIVWSLKTVSFILSLLLLLLLQVEQVGKSRPCYCHD